MKTLTLAIPSKGRLMEQAAAALETAGLAASSVQARIAAIAAS